MRKSKSPEVNLSDYVIIYNSGNFIVVVFSVFQAEDPQTDPTCCTYCIKVVLN